MDIIKSISHLLYYHDCVIIPGFGGFVCSYRQAQIHPVEHTITPPSKAISFNINLRSNDGLLANHVAKTAAIPYHQALEYIDNWVAASTALLESEKELKLPQVGRIIQDVEGGWQYEPDYTVNYLVTSFGLSMLIAAPVLRGREISIAETQVKSKIPVIRKWNSAKIAASVILIIGIGILSTLMFTGHVIEPLKLNEAGVMSFLLHFSANNEPAVKLIPPAEVKAVNAANKAEDNPQNLSAHVATVPEKKGATISPISAPGHSYYIIVGVFGSRYNVEKNRNRLLSIVPASSLYEETYNGLTRLGYLAATDEVKAKEELATARLADSWYWLLEK